MDRSLAPTDHSAAYIDTQRMVATMAATMTAAATRAARAQWAMLDETDSSDGGQPERVIDPEALLLISLWLTPRDPAMRRVVHDWVAAWSDLLSVQRTRNIAKSYPSDVHAELRAVAITAQERGKDFRWAPVIKSAGATAGAADVDDDAGSAEANGSRINDGGAVGNARS